MPTLSYNEMEKIKLECVLSPTMIIISNDFDLLGCVYTVIDLDTQTRRFITLPTNYYSLNGSYLLTADEKLFIKDFNKKYL